MSNPHLSPSDTFVRRHIGPNDADVSAMLEKVGVESLDALMEATIPADIRSSSPLSLGGGRTEQQVIDELRQLASKNALHRSFIGMGYYDCITPPVIQRNILENPGWYTQYTPYQAEISQGRLEAMLNFQTMVADLTGLPLSNSSLLDEATAAAEAMHVCHAVGRGKKNVFFVASDCHPQTIAVVRTRAHAAGLALTVGPLEDFDPGSIEGLCGVLVQYPTTDGRVIDYRTLVERVHEAGALVVVATDLLALTLLTPPGEFGADIAVGSSQRFGIPMGAGGPHAAFLATREEYKRQVPGRIVGVSHDSHGNQAYRLSLQTREQHIRRDRATSNICTAQVLLAIMASMYAVYHGPDGLRRIARRVHGWAVVLAQALARLGVPIDREHPFFDTLRINIDPANSDKIHDIAKSMGINLRRYPGGAIGVSVDETTTESDIRDLVWCFTDAARAIEIDDLIEGIDEVALTFEPPFQRQSRYLEHPRFNSFHSEHEMLRYIHRLQSRDLSLVSSMIPLGSCTMKLNATTEMLPVTWPEFCKHHPYVPTNQLGGYHELYAQLSEWLADMTGFAAVSLQPNSGAQGEYAGLLAIRAYHESREQGYRNVCLIPTSAHGTNPASAIMAGMRVVALKCDHEGNIDVDDLRAKATKHAQDLSALMITYPSTHGVFERSIREICAIVHEYGGQVYMDGANLNAQLGMCRPGDYGADVAHLNLHKTFCIPHGGGGPGMGPIVVAKHLAPFLPGDPLAADPGPVGPVSAASHGSASILTISWSYIALMGGDGLSQATRVAILNANYMAARLREHYDILYTGDNGRVAHEFVIDCRPFKKSAGISVDDIAKRLMDFGFHAPTMSWPVAGTLMIEPTESETKGELDRYCDAMLAIREEIRAIEEGRASREDNALLHAPHTVQAVSRDEWNHAYSREQAAFPAPWLRAHKFWPPVGRIDNTFGDRNLVCTCPAVEAYAEP